MLDKIIIAENMKSLERERIQVKSHWSLLECQDFLNELEEWYELDEEETLKTNGADPHIVDNNHIEILNTYEIMNTPLAELIIPGRLEKLIKRHCGGVK